MKREERKRPYEKPKIIYEKKIEILAGACPSGHGGNPSGCQIALGQCKPGYCQA